ncbi:CRISPR-associated endonuclease Cas2 [Thiomicrospira microaerophila]|uniref:CRISPR-associated endonuclease Cas2 n=1 Tax=Thiomicrospira microaerophila TaxID=406020 RepID=UPI0005CAC7AD|nr:CRISPR-associated endonuclease Cas2 [Thiomicrospira microaerophila]
MATRYPVIIAYDIKSNAMRAKMLRILKRWRLDGQKSVHECLLTRQQAQELYLQLKSIANPESDRVMLAWINQNRPIYNKGTGIGIGFFKTLFYIK